MDQAIAAEKLSHAAYGKPFPDYRDNFEQARESQDPMLAIFLPDSQMLAL